MKLDVILDARASANEIAKLGLLAEQHGFDGVWVSSLLDSRDPFTNLTTLAQQSSNIKLGPIAINPWDIHPVRIAASLYTLNEFADGRARIVIGGGGEALQAINLEPKRRVRAVQECVEILKLAGSGARNDYIGQLYQVKGYELSWLTSPMPQVYVGANMPQMLSMAARVADGVMMSDMPPSLAEAALKQLSENLTDKARSLNDFWSGSFTAWHVYADKEQARREACQWMLLRGIFRPWVLSTFLSEDEVKLVMTNAQSFVDAYINKTHVIKNIPEKLQDKLVKNLSLTGSLDDLDGLIAHLREYEAIGMQSVCLRIYTDPASSIKLIGEQVIPALN